MGSSVCGSCSENFCQDDSSCYWDNCSSDCQSSCCCDYPLQKELYSKDGKYLAWKRGASMKEFMEFFLFCRYMTAMLNAGQDIRDVNKWSAWRNAQANLDQKKMKAEYADWKNSISMEDYVYWYNFMHFTALCARSCKTKCTQYALYKYIVKCATKANYCLFKRFAVFQQYEQAKGAKYCQGRAFCKEFKCRAKAARCLDMKKQFLDWQKNGEHGQCEFAAFLRYYKCDRAVVNRLLFINRVCVRGGCQTFANDALYFYVKKYMSFSLYKKYEKFRAWYAYAQENSLDWKSMREYRNWRCTYSACIRKRNLKRWRKCFNDDDYNLLMNNFWCFLKIKAKSC